MVKNKCIVAVTLPLILIPLIWSATTKNVNADVEVDDETPQIEKVPALVPDESDLYQIEVEGELQTQSGTKTHSFGYTRVTIKDERTATANCKAITWNSRTTFPLDNNAQITCHISDLADDGDSVYLRWWLDGYASHSLNHKGKPNTTVKKIDSMAVPEGGIGTINFQVCRSIFAWPDKCSEEATWRVN